MQKTHETLHYADLIFLHFFKIPPPAPIYAPFWLLKIPIYNVDLGYLRGIHIMEKCTHNMSNHY